mgnify:CR=1 FL=1
MKIVRGYYFCSSCHTAWMKKLPHVSYEENYYKPKSGLAAQLFSPIAAFFYQIRQNYVHNKSPKIWIDVGAGEGKFLQAVESPIKIGVEISKTGRKIMNNIGIKTLTPSEFLKSKGLKANVISFWHVLEHIKNPWDYLSAAKRNLLPNGEIVIGIPNIDSWDFKIFTNDWFHLVPKYHIWHYSPKTISIMLKSTGFKVVNIDYWSIEHHLPGLLQSFINKTSGSHNVLHKLVKRETDLMSTGWSDVFWIIFWLTLGFPFVVVFWIVNSFFHHSGTIIVTAKKYDYRKEIRYTCRLSI